MAVTQMYPLALQIQTTVHELDKCNCLMKDLHKPAHTNPRHHSQTLGACIAARPELHSPVARSENRHSKTALKTLNCSSSPC